MKKVLLINVFMIAIFAVSIVPASAGGRLDPNDMFKLISTAKQIFTAEAVVDADVRRHNAQASRDETRVTRDKIRNVDRIVDIAEDGARAVDRWSRVFKNSRR